MHNMDNLEDEVLSLMSHYSTSMLGLDNPIVAACCTLASRLVARQAASSVEVRFFCVRSLPSHNHKHRVSSHRPGATCGGLHPPFMGRSGVRDLTSGVYRRSIVQPSAEQLGRSLGQRAAQLGVAQARTVANRLRTAAV